MAKISGGIICVQNSAVHIMNTTVQDTKAGSNGGALYTQSQSLVNIMNSKFILNGHKNTIGGVICAEEGTNVLINNSII